uniref:Cell growth-regulating nucleolar protein n=1 Tax=Culex pipiens TaxID=7175 RepID=A0A8D8IXS6_CULPI
MVFFTCNHCGESLKKQAVEKHGWKCKREINVSCMDCQKDFAGKAYDAHTSCITEAEKYSGKDYVPKANANKGAKKQDAWLTTIRTITEGKQNLSKGVSDVFNVIAKNDNIPRKQKGFMNFFQNSAKHIRRNDVEAAWTLLEQEVKKNQSNGQQQPVQQQKVANGTVPNGNQNGTSEAKKRKLEEEEPVEQEAKTPAKKKSKKKQNGHVEDEQSLVQNEEEADCNGSNGHQTEDKFKWTEVIRSTLVAKNNEMKLSKLRKKVLKKYQQFVGCGNDLSDKIDRKFSKKITKLGCVVDNETVRLID